MADYPADPNQRSLPGPSSYGMSTYYDNAQSNGYAGYDGQEVDSAAVEYNRAQGVAAFGYNSMFPFFSPATVASGIPPLPIYQNWPPASFSPASQPFYQSEIPESSRAASRQRTQFDDNGQSFPFDESLPRSVPAPIVADQPVEEGELSEGEFEEARPESISVEIGGSNFDREIDPSDKVQHYPPTDIYGRSIDLNKQQSPSYSPYASPVQNSYDMPPVGMASSLDDYVEPTAENVYLEYESRSRNVGARSDVVEYRHDARANKSPTSIPLPGPASGRVKSEVPHAMKIKSVAEARKEAQSAILNLWPLKVRFQNYVDEGIDEEVVRRQFEDLGMPQGTTYLSQQTENLQQNSKSDNAVRPVQSENGWNSSRSQHKSDGPDRGPLNLSSSYAANGYLNLESKSENMEDIPRIQVARLIGERGLIPAPTTSGDFSVASSSQDLSATAKSSSTVQLTAKAEKERLLMQKMENLQKSREARALKAAAKIVAAPTVSLANKAKSPTPPPIHPSDPPSMAAPPVAQLSSSVRSSSRSSSPHHVQNPQPIMPPIPGLFLSAGTAGSPMNLAHMENKTQTLSQRKRPVASDFDTVSTMTLSYKRPFGQNRTEEPLVIDVSDDESEDDTSIPMDIDQRVASSPAPSGENASSVIRATAIRDLPPLSDFPARRPFIPSSSALNTPPTPQTTARLSTTKPGEELQTKEMAIQEMKRKIADFERRKNAKQSQSGSQTPSRPDTTAPSGSNAARRSSIQDKMETSAQIEQLMDDASRKAEVDLQKLTEAHPPEQQKADENKRDEAELKRLRKAKIVADLPVLAAQVLKSQQRLADLRVEMKILEIAVQKDLADKKKLAEEMEALEREVDEQPQVQIINSGDISHEVLGNGGATPRSPSEENHGHQINDSPTPLIVTEVTETAESSPLRIVALATGENSNPEQLIIDAPNTSTIAAPNLESLSDSSEIRKDTSTETVRTSHVSSSEKLGETTTDMPAKEIPASSVAESEAAATNEVGMNNSQTPHESELVESMLSTASSMDIMVSEPTDSADDQMLSEHGDTGSDVYEPHDATPSEASETSSVESPPFSPAPPQAGGESRKTDVQPASISTGHALTSASDMSSISIISHPAGPNKVQGSYGAVTQLTNLQKNIENSPVHESRFTPYESILKQFHSYRFNSTYAREVPGGFKSVTYSNNIKDDQEICRFELAGGVCNDETCEFQHFKTMALADDAILVELGNSAGYGDEDKPKFVAGLRNVLQDLRTRKIKDFQIIASEIAAFRAAFSA